jgi:hypothetical protein
MSHALAIGELQSILGIKQKQAEELNSARGSVDEARSNKARMEVLHADIGAIERAIKVLASAACLFLVLCWAGCAQPKPAYSTGQYPWTNALTNAEGEVVPAPAWEKK